MQQLLERFGKCQKIFISGSVGVGKTTFINNFITHAQDIGIKIHIIPEYTEGDPEGIEMLKKFLNNSINNYEFQMYILNFYESYMTSILEKVNENDIIIFERLPDEGISCFANITWHENKLTDKEMKNLYYKVIEIDTKFGLPCSFNISLNPYVFTCIKTLDNVDFTGIILNIAKSCNTHLVVGLYNTTDICYKRIIKRSRDGETAYTYDKVNDFVNIYFNIYNIMLKEQNITITHLKNDIIPDSETDF